METSTVTIDPKILDFLYKIYFNFSDGPMRASVNRAYRDFNRTLKGFPKGEEKENERYNLKENWSNLMIDAIKAKLLKSKFNNWCEFNAWHKDVCERLKNRNDNYKKLTFGQAQKWLNMTLKYLFVMGDEKVNGISINYEYFHIPIDNIIQEEILKDLKRDPKDKIFKVWSQIDDYDKYLVFQREIRIHYPNKIPMDVEFELFNKGIVKENI